MRVRRHLGSAEAAHLGRESASSVSSRPAIADTGEALRLAEQLDEALRGSPAVLPSAINCSAASEQAAAIGLGREAERRQADDLALAHRDAAEDLGGVFARADPDRVVLDRAVAILALQRSP
jgi:hypothetical protein